MIKIYDISLSLSQDTPIYPNNPPLLINELRSLSEHPTSLTKIEMGVHTGTHVDAPSHAVVPGKTIGEISLDCFVGPARVLDFTKSEGKVSLENIKEKNVKTGERILLKTKNSVGGFAEFYSKYVYLDGDAADHLSEIGVLLVGIDALSIKQRGSSDVRPHTSLLSKSIPIIEGLNLKGVIEGEFFLFSPPLAFVGIEAAPARAILIEGLL